MFVFLCVFIVDDELVLVENFVVELVVFWFDVMLLLVVYDG